MGERMRLICRREYGKKTRLWMEEETQEKECLKFKN